MFEELKNISESIRSQLYACESIRNRIDQLNVINKPESRIKNQLDEMIKTVIADLLISADFVLEVLLSVYDDSGNIDESELALLLAVVEENFGEEELI